MNESGLEFRNRPENSGGGFNDYFAPVDLKEAIKLKEKHRERIKIIAGGTDILVRYYEKLYKVEYWLDLKNIGELKEIKINDGQIFIGAMVTHSGLLKSRIINEHLPVLRNAASDIGSPQIRNRGTIGGNIVNASPAGDLLPPLLAYNARFKIVSSRGEEFVRAEDFFTGPGQTILQPDQILTGIEIPEPKNSKGIWIKIGKRKALFIASFSLALTVRFCHRDIIEDVRACFGSVAPVPLEVKELRTLFKGKKLSEVDPVSAGELAANKIRPIDDHRGTAKYRRNLARNLVIKALEELRDSVDAEVEGH